MFYKLIKQKKRVLLFFTTVPLNHNLIIAIHKTRAEAKQMGSTDYALTCLWRPYKANTVLHNEIQATLYKCHKVSYGVPFDQRALFGQGFA